MRLPLSELEMEVLRFLKISPLQLHHRAWAYLKAFQFWVEY